MSDIKDEIAALNAVCEALSQGDSNTKRHPTELTHPYLQKWQSAATRALNMFSV